MLKAVIKRVMPQSFMRIYYKLRDGLERPATLAPPREREEPIDRSRLTPAQVFSRIYKAGIWGQIPSGFYSGDGSSEMYTSDYSIFVKDFIRANLVKHVVDLGCGDFRVGSKLLIKGVKYTGVDVVQELVDYSNSAFGSEDVNFQCLDIISDALPTGDLCILRQILQHLSNRQILSIIPRLSQYRFVLITEHHPSPNVSFIPNKDLVHGPGTRVEINSGVFLDQHPFGIDNLALVHSIEYQMPIVESGERLNTFLMTNQVNSTANV